MTVTHVAHASPLPDFRSARAPLSVAERWAAVIVAVAWVGFGIHGFRTGEPSTTAYLFVVALLSVGAAVVRRRPLPAWFAAGLAVLAVGHLAGGLIRVGSAVLYNTHPGWPVLQYDHLFHASASALAVGLVWTLVSDRIDGPVLAALLSAGVAAGFGALNELIEFAATLAHQGSHVGGYLNTGWDLVANTLGATVGLAVLLARRSEPHRTPGFTG